MNTNNLRIYNLLLLEWLRYMEYLKNNYAFLFSLAVCTSPFNPESGAIVREGRQDRISDNNSSALRILLT